MNHSIADHHIEELDPIVREYLRKVILENPLRNSGIVYSTRLYEDLEDELPDWCWRGAFGYACNQFDFLEPSGGNGTNSGSRHRVLAEKV